MKASTPKGRAKPLAATATAAAAAAAAASESTGGGTGSSPSHEPPQPAPMLTANVPPPFLAKTYEMVDDPSTNEIVSWSSTNNSFVVWDQPEFTRNLLPKYFKHNNFSSFVRQLNTYGFKKVDHDRHEFANKDFLRGEKHLLKTITRKKTAHGHVPQQPPQQPRGEKSTPVGPCIEIGKFGLEEEVESLKRDKNVLMQELVRLRQQQQSTDGQLQTMVQHLQGMEQRQQQMMSFLAKAVNSPGFLAQFVQQQNDSGRRITERSKKRRLKQDGVSDQTVPGTDGQIVKYQPLINEAAKAMLRQLMKLDPSPRIDGFLIGNGDASKPMDCERTNHVSSAVSLQDIPPTYVHSSQQPSASPITVQNSLTDTFDVLPPPPFVDGPLVGAQNIPPVDLSRPDITIPQLSQLPGISPEGNADILSLDTNEELSLDSDDLASDTHIDWDSTLFEVENMEDLPRSIDPFWEKFLKSPSHAFETDEMEFAAHEGGNMKPHANGWGKSQHLDQLTMQMGNLGSEAESV